MEDLESSFSGEGEFANESYIHFRMSVVKLHFIREQKDPKLTLERKITTIKVRQSITYTFYRVENQYGNQNNNKIGLRQSTVAQTLVSSPSKFYP